MSPASPPYDLLRFEEAYFERVWGGARLRPVLGKDTPADKVIGEAWMVSDHAEHESVVAAGPHAGRTLRELLAENAAAILGARARLTVHGRFPLLLKILDTGKTLSVQVHPDDDDAARLGEPDVGKTEMWHVLESAPGGKLLCGLGPGVTAETFRAAIEAGSVGDLLGRIEAEAGASIFVPAGTVHAIGEGVLLAEIQQNSDLTYRVFDWNRVGIDGKPRALHLEKAVAATRFGLPAPTAQTPLAFAPAGDAPEGVRTALCACGHFAAELVEVSGVYRRATRGESFHLLLVKRGRLKIQAEGEAVGVGPGDALLAPACAPAYTVAGEGAVLDYFVPDLQADIAGPLLAAGHAPEDIVRLGGDPSLSDLRAYL